jgi:hypothetical protein
MKSYNKTPPSLPAITTATTTLGTQSYKQNNAVQYFTYQGDANRHGPQSGGFGQIDCGQDPCDDYIKWGTGSLVPQILYGVMQRWEEVDTPLDPQFRLTGPTVNTETKPPYPGNDFVVTEPSAKAQPYSPDGKPTFTALETFHANHSTIGFSGQVPADPDKYPDVAQELCDRFTSMSLKPSPSGAAPLQILTK